MVHLTTALDPSSSVPLYEQLYHSLAGEMRSGTLSAGVRMPGKRRLAAELSVSVNTVDAAYQMLAAEGYLESRERSGFYVQEYLALPSRPAGLPQPPAPPVPPPAPPVRYDLSTRGVDPGLFPFRTWARLQKELLYSSPELLTHGDAQGDPALRRALAEYLSEYRGVQCGPHQIVVGAGLEYLLSLLAPLLPGIVRLTRLHNTGAAWSSFSGKTGLLAAVTIVLMAAVVYLVVKKIVRHPLGLTAAMLVLGGGAGNMIDRLCRGYVVDMFDLEFMSYPIFNLADIFVVIGVLLGAVYYLWFYDKYDKPKKEPDHDAGADSRN